MLPNLPLLVGQWEISLTEQPLIAAQWSPITNGDVCRWFLSVDDPQGNGPLLTTDLTLPVTSGFVIAGFSFREFKYQDYGPIVGLQWYAFGRFGNQPVTVYTAAIRLRRDFLESTEREQAEKMEQAPELKTLIVTLLDRLKTGEVREQDVLGRY